ncbi:MAG: DUF4133 domain-containing protein [Flavobacterium sp.]|nr:MAG: DUF4133 domain-containing protein [Flavobacterium sp.]
MSLVFQVNKGMGKPIVFKGFQGQYIGYLAGGMVLLLIGFTLGYIAGAPLYVLLPSVLLMGVGLLVGIGRLSRRFGVDGLAKFIARRGLPDYLRFSSRRVFTGLKYQPMTRKGRRYD